MAKQILKGDLYADQNGGVLVVTGFVIKTQTVHYSYTSPSPSSQTTHGHTMPAQDWKELVSSEPTEAVPTEPEAKKEIGKGTRFKMADRTEWTISEYGDGTVTIKNPRNGQEQVLTQGEFTSLVATRDFELI